MQTESNHCEEKYKKNATKNEKKSQHGSALILQSLIYRAITRRLNLCPFLYNKS